MGFEITFRYYERNEDGSYNTEEVKDFKKKVGKPYDETPLEQAAKVILAQLAKRNILVIGTDVQEFVKRDVSFKESADGYGIILKGKKFTIDSTEGVDVITSEEEVIENSSTSTSLTTFAIDPNIKNKVLFEIVFIPENPIEGNQKSIEYKVTVNKAYPVHKQKDHPLGGSFYTITNDRGGLVEVDEKYFIVKPKGLIGAQFNEPDNLINDSRLSYSNAPIHVDRKQIPAEYAHLPIDGQEANYYDNMPMQDIRAAR